MTKGFVTIATGNVYYYKIAVNLLMSYRHFSKDPLPFAIIAEEENEYTALFDDVVITTEAMRSFCDKFLLLKLCPYDETIFIDADSLAYGDLNELWTFFQDATDFSTFGKNHTLDDNNGAWYNVGDIGAYGKKIEYKTRSHSGVCFIRKSDSLSKMYQDCMELMQNYNQLHFHSYAASVDECVLGVAMPMNNMKAIQQPTEFFGAYPCMTKLSTNMYNGGFSCRFYWGAKIESGVLLHWGTAQTREPLYKFEVECLNLLSKKDKVTILEKILYKYKIRYMWLWLLYFPKTFFINNINRIKRKLFKKK